MSVLLGEAAVARSGVKCEEEGDECSCSCEISNGQCGHVLPTLVLEPALANRCAHVDEYRKNDHWTSNESWKNCPLITEKVAKCVVWIVISGQQSGSLTPIKIIDSNQDHVLAPPKVSRSTAEAP